MPFNLLYKLTYCINLLIYFSLCVILTKRRIIPYCTLLTVGGGEVGGNIMLPLIFEFVLIRQFCRAKFPWALGKLLKPHYFF